MHQEDLMAESFLIKIQYSFIAACLVVFLKMWYFLSYPRISGASITNLNNLPGNSKVH